MNDLFLRKEKNMLDYTYLFHREDREPKVKGEI